MECPKCKEIAEWDWKTQTYVTSKDGIPEMEWKGLVSPYDYDVRIALYQCPECKNVEIGEEE